jgi:hypothetical protein
MKNLVWVVVVLWMAGCSSTRVNTDAGDFDAPVDTPFDCGPTDANNDPQCPATYQSAPCRQPCSTPDLRCSYPNVGDGPDSHGCFATAVALCTSSFQATDGGTPVWVCAQ